MEARSWDRTLGTPCTPAMVQVVATGKVEVAVTEEADVGEGTYEAVDATTKSVVALSLIHI